MGRSALPFQDAPPIACLSIAPGRVHCYEIPAHWYGGRPGGNGGTRDPSRVPVTPDPEKAARRSQAAARECAGWLWLNSRLRYVDTPGGKTVPFRLAMWTLTIPEPMPEVLARKALSEWWTWCRNVGGVGSYLWVAELTKRGRVHFHALVTSWMDVAPARAAWFRALQRHGAALGWTYPPPALVRVDNCTTARAVTNYVAKYIGKDFGARADQLVDRLRWMGGPDGAPVDARTEIRARLVEALHQPRKLSRRWGASNDVERRPVQVVSVDDPGQFAALAAELRALPGMRWMPKGDHGQPGYFDLDKLSNEAAPRLRRLLLSAAKGEL